MSTTIPERVQLGPTTLNRDWYLDVNIGTVALPDWIGVFGIQEFQPGKEATKQEDSDFDSDGWQSQTSTALAWTLTCTVKRAKQKNVEPAAYDPGQEVLRLASDELGDDNSVHVRWYKYDDVKAEAYDGYAAVDWSPNGGDMTALDTVGVTLTGQGKRNKIPFPTESAPAAWQASHAYVFGDTVSLTGGAIVRCTQAGTSGASEPAAPAVIGATVVDGGVTWLRTA